MLLLCAAVQARTWPITRFDSTIQVAEDGSAVVIEQFEFPSVPKVAPAPPVPRWMLPFELPDSAFRRRVRVNTPGPLGTRHMLFVRVVGVFVDGGRAGQYTVRNSGEFLEITVPVAPGPNRVVEIQYLVKNAARFLADHDELYWEIPNTFGINLGQVSLRVALPAAAEGQFRAQAFLAGRGGPQPLPAEVEGAAARFTASVLPYNDGINATVVLPKGFLHEPGALRRAGWFLRANLILLLPVVVFGVMYWLWHKKARNYLPGLSVGPRYEPPEGLTPAEVGALVDDRVDPRDITSTLVDLAVRGYIRIEEAPHEGGSAGSGAATPPEPDYIFRLLRPREQWSGLEPHEYTTLFHTFYGGQWTMLSSLRLRFYAVASIVAADIMDSLKRKGMYRMGPDAAPVFRLLGFGVIAVVVLLAARLGLVPLYQSLVSAAVAVAGSAAIVYLFSLKMTAKTFKGMRAYTQILGLQEFINSVEGDRFDRLQPGSFEKLLPYAMALGVEHRWTRAFHGIAQAPDWYQFAEGGLVDSILFGKHLDVLARQASAVLAAAPRGRAPQRRKGLSN